MLVEMHLAVVLARLVDDIAEDESLVVSMILLKFIFGSASLLN